MQMDEITVMGIRIRRSPVSSASANGCLFLQNGFCKSCTCRDCQAGFYIDEWREEQKKRGWACGPRECVCRDRARNQKRLRDSGLACLVERCTFSSFKTEEPWQRTIKEKAQEYLPHARRAGFFIAGQSGCGKTHICTAVCGEIMNRGGRLRYFQWVRDGTRLKQLVSERGEYERALRELIETPYLYLDDLFKQEITAADIRLAYELLSARCNAGRPTIISSERSLKTIRAARDGDGEAIAGRIYESCDHGRFCLQLTGGDKNRRFACA